MKCRNQTPFQVAYNLSVVNSTFKKAYFVCDCNIGYSVNTLADIDFWLDVRLELKRIKNTNKHLKQ